MQTERRFLDGDGRVKQWPSKQPDKLLVLAYLAARFDFDATYTEAEVNELLKRWHTFSDWPLLRRELCDRGFLERSADGSKYHILRIKTSLPGLSLTIPNLEADPEISLGWLAGEAGRETLRLMGSTEANNRPSTLKDERQRVRDFITSTKQRTWSLRYGGKTIGAIWVNLKPTEYLGAPSLHLMIGNPAERGQGIGSAATQAVIELLMKEGRYEMLYSRHLVGNTGSTKLLAKTGFANDGGQYQGADGLPYQNVKRAVSQINP